MESIIRSRVAPRKSSWVPLAALWVAFGGFALFIQRAVGCPLAGCSNAVIAFAAAMGLALLLGVLLTHTDRLTAHARAAKER